MKARKEKHLKNYKVNQNGKIFIAKAGTDGERLAWEEVKDLKALSTATGRPMPLVEEG